MGGFTAGIKSRGDQMRKIVVLMVMCVGLFPVALLAGEATRSCSQELAELKAEWQIGQDRRQSAEKSWAHFFVRVRALEEERTVLLKQIETLKNGAKPAQEPNP